MTWVRMSWLAGAAAAVALGGCTGSGNPEADLPDSAMLQVPADPAAAPQPIQAESVTQAPTRTPARTPSGSAAPAQPAPTTPARPPLRQPPEARDIRPSIPYPPDTL